MTIFETSSFWIAAFIVAWTAITAVPFALLYFKRRRDEANHLPPLPSGSIQHKRRERVSQ